MVAAPSPPTYNAAVDLVDRNLRAGRAAKIAYVDDREAVSFAALAERVDRAGDVLRGLGVEVEQRVLLAMLDTVDYPRWIEFVQELPKTATGKIQRYRLRA